MPATGPKAELAPRPSGEAATLEAGQATHGATAGAVPEVPLAEAMALLNLPLREVTGSQLGHYQPCQHDQKQPGQIDGMGRLPSRRTS